MTEPSSLKGNLNHFIITEYLHNLKEQIIKIYDIKIGEKLKKEPFYRNFLII